MKRVLIILLSVLSIIILSVSCGTTTSKTEQHHSGILPAVQEQTTTAQSAAPSATVDRGEKLYPELEGSPLPNSNLYGNWPATRPALKDDFELAVNYDLYMKAAEQEPASLSFYNDSDAYQEKTIRDLLADTSKTSDELELLRGYISLFTDYEKRNADGKNPLMSYVAAVWDASSVNELSELLSRPYLIFGNPFAKFYITNSIEDYGVYGVRIISNNPVAGRVTSSQVTQEEVDSISDYLYALLLFADYDEEFAKTMIDGILGYEKNCYDVFQDYKQKNPDDQATLTLDEIKEFFPPLYSIIIGQGYYSEDGIPVTYDVRGVSDFIAMTQMWDDENLEVLKAIIVAQMTDYAIPYLAADAVAEFFEVDGGESDPADTAYDFLRAKLSGAVDQVFLEFAFPAGTREKITELTGLYVNAMRNRILSEDWLSEGTKAKAIEKLDNMVCVVVYPDEWLDFSDLLALVKDHDQNLLDAVLCCDDFYRDYNTSFLGLGIERGNWVLSATNTTEPNAYYIQSENSINILAGILYEGLYSDSSIETMLGTVGATIGHEITHAFDTEGSDYNAIGMKENWWTDEDRASFNARAARVAEKIGAIYYLDGYRADGFKVLDETVADLGGIVLSLDIASQIDAFDYDLFFTSSAGPWFKVIADRDTAIRTYDTDDHSADYVRCNFCLQQFDKFYEVYGIVEGDWMYVSPDSRVTVW